MSSPSQSVEDKEIQPPKSDSEKSKPTIDDEKEVSLTPAESPKTGLSKRRRWLIAIIIYLSTSCVTFDSSIAAFTEQGTQQDFHISPEISVLAITLFLEGLGIGPLFLGPLSEFYGRWKVYIGSYSVLWACSWGVAFAPNAATFFIFRFLTGFASSAFLSVAGGSMSDMFANNEIAYPMAFYTLSPFVGPVIAPLIAGFIVQHTTWRWAYYLLLVWKFVQLVLLIMFVPETYEPILKKRKAQRLRVTTGDTSYFAPIEKAQKNITLLKAIIMSCYKPFAIMFTEPMALLLDIWAALVLGILYLSFQAFPIIFGDRHHFNFQSIGLTFLGIGIGMVGSLFTQGFWIKQYKKHALQRAPAPPLPEIRLLPGFAGAICIPLSLYLVAFTSYSKVPWIIPIIMSIPFGAGILFTFTSVFTYIVVAYRDHAASAMAGNSFLRSAFAGSFPLFVAPMFDRLGTAGSLALMAGVMTAVAPLPFVFYKVGPRLRKHSKWASD